MKKSRDKEKLTQYYRWQFLRRNREYRDAVDRFNQSFPEVQKNKQDSQKLYLEETLKEFMSVYGINGIFDYGKKQPHPQMMIYGVSDWPIVKGGIADVYGASLQENQQVQQRVHGDYLLEKRGGVFFRKAFQVVVNCDAEWGRAS